MPHIIDLRRITSPLIPRIDNDVRETLRTIASTWHPSNEMRQHRRFGTVRDREAAARFLAPRYERAVDPDRVFLANGTQNVLFVLLSALCERGSTVLAERMTYRQIREVAAILGLNVAGVALDSNGVVPEAFEDACKQHSPKVLYCIPTLQNPTATVMPMERRLAIAAIARKYGVVLIEDEAQGLIPSDAPRPFSEVAPDITWTVTGLSKCTLVGLRIAYVVAPEQHTLARVMRPFEEMALWYASVISATLMTHLVESGAAGGILKSIRAAAVKRQSMAAMLLPAAMTTSGHGLHVWLNHPERTGDELREAARQNGVLVRSGSEYCIVPKQDAHGIRVSLADVSEPDLSDALGRLTSSILQADVLSG